MSVSRINQQLIDLNYQIDVLKADLFQSKEQFESMDELAQDAKIRAMVSETPDQANYSHDLAATRDRLAKVIASINEEIRILKLKQDELLEKLFEESKDSE